MTGFPVGVFDWLVLVSAITVGVSLGAVVAIGLSSDLLRRQVVKAVREAQRPEEPPATPVRNRNWQPKNGAEYKGRASELFESVVKNTGFFNEFSLALTHLEQGERPYIWLSAEIAGLREARVLVTNRRIAIFQVRLLGAPRLSLVGAYNLHALASTSVTKVGDKHASLTVAFDDPPHFAVSLSGLSAELAEEAKRFLALSHDERAGVAERLGSPLQNGPG